MSSEEQLIERFPRLFRGKGPHISGYVDDGWHTLLIRLFERIDSLLSDYEAAAFQVDQIKEKFGRLCVYVSMSHDAPCWSGNSAGGDLSAFERVNALIDDAALEASATCEQCGAPGKLRLGGWLKTLCDRHDAERSADWRVKDKIK